MNNSHSIIQFHPEHMRLLVMKPVEARLLDWEYLSAQIASAGAAHTLFIDGRVVAVYGFVERFPGVIVVFVVPSVYVSKYPVIVFRHTCRMLNNLEETIRPLHRIETMAFASADIDKWMERLGFVCEGVHKNWSRDKDTFKTWARYIE